MRDGAVAASGLHEMLWAKTKADPPPEASAAFSLCVDPNNAELRIHGRQPQQDGSFRWLAAVVGPDQGRLAMLAKEKDIFRISSYVVRILEWAQTNAMADDPNSYVSSAHRELPTSL